MLWQLTNNIVLQVIFEECDIPESGTVSLVINTAEGDTEDAGSIVTLSHNNVAETDGLTQRFVVAAAGSEAAIALENVNILTQGMDVEETNAVRELT